MMDKNIKKIQKMTSRGQITLPAEWRKKVGTGQVILRAKGDSLEISPLYLCDDESTGEYTVFDALRDNKGKGLKADDLISILEKLNG